MVQIFKLPYFYSKAERVSREKLRENYLWNSLGFQAQSEDLRLECCILGKNPKNKSTGSNVAQDPPKNPTRGGGSDHELINTSHKN